MTIDHVRPTSRAADRLEPSRARLINTSRAKRGLEVVAALSGIVLLALPMLIIALAIKLNSPGPVLFHQERVGLEGRTFSILKFRTMTRSASLADFRQAERDDARVTRVGKLLRRLSLDELPQLFNVLLGDMALIGPRPHPVELDAAYVAAIPDYMARYSVRPGITGWAQVNGHRGETRTLEQMQDRVAHDLQYIQNWSLPLDLEILFRTVFSWRAYANAF